MLLRLSVFSLALAAASAAAIGASSPQQALRAPAESQLTLASDIDFDSVLSTKFPDFYRKYHKQHNLSSIFTLHKELVDIQSTSKHEEPVAGFLVDFLEAQGLTVETQPLEGSSRYNVYAYYADEAKTASKHRRVLLTSHVDTVPPFIPYRFNESSGAISGRGTNDAKGSIVSQVHSALELISEGKINRYEDVAFLYVVGEEISGDGMRSAVKYFDERNSRGPSSTGEYGWDTVIFGEPTENKLGSGHKGNYMFNLEVYGKASHSGYPHLGVSSNEILVDVLWQLWNHTDTYPSSELLGPTTFNVGQLQGGIAQNVLPSYSSAGVFFRVADKIGELHAIVNGILRSVNKKYHARYPDFQPPLLLSEPEPGANQNSTAALEGGFLDGPFVFRRDLARKLPQYLDFEVPGFESIALAFATDIPDFTIKVNKRHLYGPGSILSAHGDSEHITIDELIENLDGYKKLILYNLK